MLQFHSEKRINDMHVFYTKTRRISNWCRPVTAKGYNPGRTAYNHLFFVLFDALHPGQQFFSHFGTASWV